MKSSTFSLLAVILLLSACKVTTIQVAKPMANPSGKVPPGQMKKATGTQSAKTFATGQQKKNGTPSHGNPKKK